MGFYALNKRCKFVLEDMIAWYKQKLYDDWYNSLTPEQRNAIERDKNTRVIKALASLCICRAVIANSNM